MDFGAEKNQIVTPNNNDTRTNENGYWHLANRAVKGVSISKHQDFACVTKIKR
jgi:hypothetical protein